MRSRDGGYDSRCLSKRSTFASLADVIDLGEARKRLRPKELDAAHGPPVTKALALADEFQSLLDSGAVKRRADLARRFNLSRARVTQLLDLHKLHPDILEFVRHLSGVGPRYLSVRALLLICPLPHEQQLGHLQAKYPKIATSTAVSGCSVRESSTTLT